MYEIFYCVLLFCYHCCQFQKHKQKLNIEIYIKLSMLNFSRTKFELINKMQPNIGSMVS